MNKFWFLFYLTIASLGTFIACPFREAWISGLMSLIVFVTGLVIGIYLNI